MRNLTPAILAELIDTIRDVYACAYSGDQCDCKFGAHNLFNSSTESGNGCPELRVIAEVLRAMTPEVMAALLDGWQVKISPKPNTKPRTYTEDEMEMILGLIDACGRAGGNFQWDQWKDKPVSELVEFLAPNKVRFTHNPE